jgi:biopolymer transport protein ExbD
MIRKIPRQQLVAEINITPFTDVILVLLVIFMITAPLLSQAGFKIKLPRASSAIPTQTRGKVSISITGEGLVYLGKDLVTSSELKAKMQAVYHENPEVSVSLSADKDCAFKDVAGVLDILTAIGIARLNIATAPQDKIQP